MPHLRYQNRSIRILSLSRSLSSSLLKIKTRVKSSSNGGSIHTTTLVSEMSSAAITTTTDTLIEKRKSQLSLMLNWTKQPTPSDSPPNSVGASPLSPSSLEHGEDPTTSLFDSLNNDAAETVKHKVSYLIQKSSLLPSFSQFPNLIYTYTQR